MVGLYLLGDEQLPNKKGLVGVEGVLLAVDETIRGKGFGNQLKDYVLNLNYDYIWGKQLKSLNNLKDWLKRRELVGTTYDCYITLELFNKK